MKHRKPTPMPLPDGMTVHDEWTDPDGRHWTRGEFVWVKGWPKSKTARHQFRRVVRRDGYPDDVQVWFEHRGSGQMHSIDPTRLGKRRKV